MDSITQAALGAAIGESVLGKRLGSKAAIAGAIIATIPDSDVVLHLFYDRFDMLSIHRGLSHSIFFSFFAALLLYVVMSQLHSFRHVKPVRLYLFAWLCLFTHIVLDAFTAYGTQLFLPFSDIRVGFDSINVVDPVYTLPLLIGLALSLRTKMSKPSRSRCSHYGLLISTCYLLFTLVNKSMVNTKVASSMDKHEIAYNALMTIPVGVANMRWYGVAKGQDSIHMMRYNTFTRESSSPVSFPINEWALDLIDSAAADKMRWFARGFYTVEKASGSVKIYNLKVDMRGMVLDRNPKAPTVGYFEISHGDVPKFSCGSLLD